MEGSPPTPWAGSRAPPPSGPTKSARGASDGRSGSPSTSSRGGTPRQSPSPQGPSSGRPLSGGGGAFCGISFDGIRNHDQKLAELIRAPANSAGRDFGPIRSLRGS